MTSIALDTSPIVTVGTTAMLGWILFLPTEDLVWMHQRGYISPQYVRLALLWAADKVGFREDGVYHDYDDGEKAVTQEGHGGLVNGSGGDETTARAKAGAVVGGGGAGKGGGLLRRGGRLGWRRARAPVMGVVHAVLKWQGLIQKENEERAELERLRRQAHQVSTDGHASIASGDGKIQNRRVVPHPSTWPHRPVFVRFNPRAPQMRALKGWATRWGPDTSGKNEPAYVDLSCPVNTETCMEFESELFVGKIVCRFKGVGCPANPSAIKTKEEFFRRKRCTFQVLVQGKFKEAVPAHKILTGGEFSKPFTDRPPTYLVSAGCKFFMALTPGLQVDMLCDEPYYMAILGGTATVLGVHKEADAPDPLGDLEENTDLLGGEFKGTNASISERCRILGNPTTAADYVYNTTDVYSFDYFQSVLLFDSYSLDIGIVKLKLDRHLNGQPLGIMAKHADGRYVYNFEIFHECLLAKSDQAPPGHNWA